MMTKDTSSAREQIWKKKLPAHGANQIAEFEYVLNAHAQKK